MHSKLTSNQALSNERAHDAKRVLSLLTLAKHRNLSDLLRSPIVSHVPPQMSFIAYPVRCHVTTNSVAPTLLQKLHTIHNSSIRSDEGLTLEKSAFRIPVRWSIYIINSVDKTKFNNVALFLLNDHLQVAFFSLFATASI